MFEIQIILLILNKTNEYVINALSLMPKWKPALHNGKQIKSTFVLPLTFKIN